MNRILVIDDSELVSTMVSEFLGSHGYDVSVAHDANQGFQLATKQPPDLILLDVHLPDVIGFEVCKVLRSRPETKHVPIIMITGAANQTEQKVKGFQAGADDYLLKPFENDELLERIRAVMRRSEAKRPVPSPALRAPSPIGRGQGEAVGEASPRLPIAQLFTMALLSPNQLPPKVSLTGVSLVFLAAALGLGMGGIGVAAEPTVKSAMVAAAVLGTWGCLVFVAVMSASLMGSAIAWSEASGILSLAAAPLLLKYIGALGMSLVTTLSPFHFTMGPALFNPSAPTWWMRLDAFELWAVALLYLLLSRRFQRARGKALLVTVLVWVVGVAIALGLERLGKP